MKERREGGKKKNFFYYFPQLPSEAEGFLQSDQWPRKKGWGKGFPRTGARNSPARHQGLAQDRSLRSRCASPVCRRLGFWPTQFVTICPVGGCGVETESRAACAG